MKTHFIQGDFVGGLTMAIIRCGEQLKVHKKKKKNDVNELPDEISFGK